MTFVSDSAPCCFFKATARWIRLFLQPQYGDSHQQMREHTMVKLNYAMTMIIDGEEYRLNLPVERDYGREPIAGEIVVIGEVGTAVATRVTAIEWYPHHCTVAVEPAPGVLVTTEPASSLTDQLRQYVAAGFRCPWTGYPPGVDDPDHH